jgi:hypothetical protein
MDTPRLPRVCGRGASNRDPAATPTRLANIVKALSRSPTDRTEIARRLGPPPDADAAAQVLMKSAMNPDLRMVETVDLERRPV